MKGVTEHMNQSTLLVGDAAVTTVRTLIGAAHETIGRLGAEAPRIARWAALLKTCLAGGGVVVTAGNGGSAAHAAHLAGELTGRFMHERPPLRAVCLASDGPTITAIANDYGYEEVFARQVRALVQPGDVVVLFSMSGRSANVVSAARASRLCGGLTLAFTGAGANPLRDVADDVIAPTAPNTAAIQDAHQVALHALCAGLDHLLGVTAAKVA
jgi:D-sedoheptulose 7-phosphate isomerase